MLVWRRRDDGEWRWRVGVGEIAVKVGQIQPPPFIGINPDQNWID